MLTPAAADAAIAAAVAVWPQVDLPLDSAANAILREDIRAERDQPPFDRVMMDGIAVASAAVAAGRRAFRIAGVQAAGAPQSALTDPECCLEAYTGAVLPAGCDAVIPVEELAIADGWARLGDDAVAPAGRNVHPRGSDGLADAIVLRAGMRLTPPALAVAASANRLQLRVTAAPRIAVVSTGDELVPPGRPVLPHQIRRSNPYALCASLARAGYAVTTDRHLPDDPATLERELAGLLAAHDVVLLSGGVSAGRFDHVPAALAAIGVERRLHKVAQRPGKPLWFGVGPAGQLVFGLPGNPVSVLVCLVRYVLPALQRATGEAAGAPLRVALGHDWKPSPTLTTFVPATWSSGDDARVVATLRPTRGSGDFPALVGTAGFVEIPPGDAPLPAGCVASAFHW